MIREVSVEEIVEHGRKVERPWHKDSALELIFTPDVLKVF